MTESKLEAAAREYREAEAARERAAALLAEADTVWNRAAEACSAAAARLEIAKHALLDLASTHD